MPLWTLDDIAAATKGQWSSNLVGLWHAQDVHISGSHIKKNDLIFSLHAPSDPESLRKHIQSLFDAGASAIVNQSIPDTFPANLRILKVKNPRTAIDDLASAARERLQGKVFSITGSVGKSSTREMLKHVLTQQGKTHATFEDSNDSVGVALSLCQTPKDTLYAIYEMGTYTSLDSIKKSSALTRPHIGIITQVSPAHLDIYNSINGLAEESCKIFDFAQPNAIAIINRDSQVYDYTFNLLHEKNIHKIITFGEHPNSDFRLINYSGDSYSGHITASAGQKTFGYSISIPGKHFAFNSLVVLAATYACGADWLQAASDLYFFKAPDGVNDWETRTAKNGSFQLLDANLNATPAVLQANLSVMESIKPEVGRKKIAVFGDLPSLAHESEKLHRELAPYVIKAGINHLFTIGNEMYYLNQELQDRIKTTHADNLTELKKQLVATVQPGDIVIIKGSEASKISQLVKSLHESEKNSKLENQLDNSQWKAEDIIHACGGQWLSFPPTDWSAGEIAIRRRNFKKGALVFCTYRKEFNVPDFNDEGYLNELADKKVACAVISHKPAIKPDNLPLLLVENVRQALNNILRAARNRFKGKLVAITGTSGKTSTTSALTAILSILGKTHGTKWSYNSGEDATRIMANNPPDAKFSVIEVCATPGQMPFISKTLRPNVVIITNIGSAHLSYLYAPVGVADIKSQLFIGLEPNGTAILNRDDKFYHRVKEAAIGYADANILSFGRHAKANARLIERYQEGHYTHIKADFLGKPISFQIKAHGEHWALNALAVLCTVYAVGGDIDKAIDSMTEIKPVNRRGFEFQVNIGDGHITLVDDSYNSNPTSMEAAISQLSEIPLEKGRRILIIGDMLALGDKEESLHKSLLEPIVQSGIDKINTCGKLMHQLYKILPSEKKGEHAENSSSFSETMYNHFKDGDTILVKDSNGSKMNIVVEKIKALGNSLSNF